MIENEKQVSIFFYLSSALSILRPGAISSCYTIRAERIQANSLKFKQFSKEIIYTAERRQIFQLACINL